MLAKYAHLCFITTAMKQQRQHKQRDQSRQAALSQTSYGYHHQSAETQMAKTS